MKMKIDSQWMENVYIPVRVGQLTKAAKLAGKKNFASYADDTVDLRTPTRKVDERQAVADWLDSREKREVAVKTEIA